MMYLSVFYLGLLNCKVSIPYSFTHNYVRNEKLCFAKVIKAKSFMSLDRSSYKVSVFL